MNKVKKEWLILIGIIATALLIVLNFSAILTWISEFIGMLFPLLMGMVLAFVLNVPMKRIEQGLEKLNFPQKFRRATSILTIIVILLCIISLLLWIITPMIADTVSQLSSSVNHLIEAVLRFVKRSNLLQSSEVSQITDMLSQSNLVSSVISFLGGFTTNITGIFSNVFSVIMGIFFMINILASKELLGEMSFRILRVLLPKERVEHIRYVGEVVIDTYDRFLMSQLIEALIVGVMIFAGYSLAGLPYAALVGVLAGVFSFIPYIGPFMACGIGALFIFVQSPIQALISVVVYMVVQTIEDNVVYPKVVGTSVGLPTVLTLAAALIGGNLFGLVGLIFFTPIFAVIYRLVKEWVEKKEQEQAAPVVTEEGVVHEEN